MSQFNFPDGMLAIIRKNGRFSWQNFNSFDLRLSRININSICKNRINNHFKFKNFMERSSEKYKNRYPQAVLQLIIENVFGLGTRTGDYFFRLYKTSDHFLKFKLEIKKTKAKVYESYFFNLP